KYKVFSEVMHDAGVHVGANGKTWGPGIARTADGKPRSFGMITGAKKGDHAAAFRAFLAARSKDKPFFFWFGSHFPHRAYKLDSGLAAGKKPSDIDRVPACWPDNDVVRRDMLDYAVAVENFDQQVGALLKELRASGLADNTLVIVTSDH